MELINDLKTDWKFRNARIIEWNAANPLMPVTLFEPNENEFEKWVDVVDQEDYALMYTPETATDFTGIYYTHELVFEWCNEYEVDRSKPMIYGVADNIGQVLEYLKDYESEIGKCIININPIYKKDQPEDDGWRWHKWGPYIGNFKPQHEYIYDEKDIELVLCFEVIHLKDREVSLEEEHKQKTDKAKTGK